MIEQLKNKDYSICEKISDVLSVIIFIVIYGFIIAVSVVIGIAIMGSVSIFGGRSGR